MTGRRPLTIVAALLGTWLVMALPGTARAGSEAEPDVATQHDTGPASADRFFHVEWSAAPAERDQSRIVGYVYNDYREDAVNVQLRISELDESGRRVASILQPVGETIRAGSRAFFDARIPGSGPSYRVAVASFDFMADGEWKTLTTEELLATVGFHKKVADTPAKLAHLEMLTPARKLVAHRHDEQVYYVYADPDICKCLYVGTAAQYQIALERRLVNEELVATQEHKDDDAVVWALWAPWP
jgi:hypothetical protein